MLDLNSKVEVKALRPVRAKGEDDDRVLALEMKLLAEVPPAKVISLFGSSDVSALEQALWDADGERRFYCIEDILIQGEYEDFSINIVGHESDEVKIKGFRLHPVSGGPTLGRGTFLMQFKAIVTHPPTGMLAALAERLDEYASMKLYRKQEEMDLQDAGKPLDEPDDSGREPDEPADDEQGDMVGDSLATHDQEDDGFPD